MASIERAVHTFSSIECYELSVIEPSRDGAGSSYSVKRHRKAAAAWQCAAAVAISMLHWSPRPAGRHWFDPVSKY